MQENNFDQHRSPRLFYLFNSILTLLALFFLTYLLVIRRGNPSSMNLRFLPSINALFNSIASVCMVAGVIAIKRKAQRLHQYLMTSAFACSVLFLIGYLIYHYTHGDTKYFGPHRTLYLIILASHVLLSMSVIPLTLSAFYFAWRKKFSTHRRVTRFAFPIWLYVSVTGVLIYFMLRGSMLHS